MKKIIIDQHNIDAVLIKEAVRYLEQGKIVAVPTETVYGLAVVADNPDAVQRLYALKKRAADKPFTVAVDSSQTAIDRYFSTLSPFGYRLIENFWPGPLTIIFWDKSHEKIGIRVPAQPILIEVLRGLQKSIFLPSANLGGEPEAVSANQVEQTFSDTIDAIIDGGQCLYQGPSTVIDLTYYPFKILRQGVLAERKIVGEFIRKRVLFVCSGNTCRSPMAQFLLQKYMQDLKPYAQQRYEILSRGISALSGSKMAAFSLSILQEEENLEVVNFYAQQLDQQMVRSSDLIFTMEESQRGHILTLEPTAEGRVFTLRQFLPAEFIQDIPDPYGGNRQDYLKVYELIRKAIRELIHWL